MLQSQSIQKEWQICHSSPKIPTVSELTTLHGVYKIQLRKWSNTIRSLSIIASYYTSHTIPTLGKGGKEKKKQKRRTREGKSPTNPATNANRPHIAPARIQLNICSHASDVVRLLLVIDFGVKVWLLCAWRRRRRSSEPCTAPARRGRMSGAFRSSRRCSKSRSTTRRRSSKRSARTSASTSTRLFFMRWGSFRLLDLLLTFFFFPRFWVFACVLVFVGRWMIDGAVLVVYRAERIGSTPAHVLACIWFECLFANDGWAIIRLLELHILKFDVDFRYVWLYCVSRSLFRQLHLMLRASKWT